LCEFLRRIFKSGHAAKNAARKERGPDLKIRRRSSKRQFSTMEFGHPSGQRLLSEVGAIFAGNGRIFEKRSKHILFVCGGPIGGSADSLRSRFLTWAKQELPDVVLLLAEDAYRESYSEQLPEFIDLSKFEQLIGGVSDCILIFPESVGSYAEIGVFSQTPIKKKILIANEGIYHNGDSFLNLGPVSHINSKSLLRPAIPINRERVEDGFAAVRERLGRLKRRSNRRLFRFRIYKQLSMEDKLVAVLATVTLLRAVSLPGLVQSMKTTFQSANRREVQHLLSVLSAGGYLLRSDEYFCLNPAAESLVEFEKIYVSDFVGRATYYYLRYHPVTLEHLRSALR
jgi:hypothetical protein